MKKNILEYHGIGASFYPEQYDSGTWPKWMNLLAEAHIGFVRMGEFFWDKLEPREGVYDFSWLDEIFNQLRKKEIKVLLCTPTAAPPVWVSRSYPDTLPVLSDGRTYSFGIRKHFCHSSENSIAFSEKITEEIARRYASDNIITGWQIDNEYGHPFCHCSVCKQKFTEWLEKEYGTVDNLNRKLKMNFWAQSLEKFSDIPFPVKEGFSPNIWLAYHRFHSANVISFYRRQIEILRKYNTTAPIATNTMVTWHGYDHEENAKNLDIVGVDLYAKPALAGFNFEGLAFESAYVRGMKPGVQNIWYHEAQCGRAGNTYPLPGQTRFWSLLFTGLGGNRITYFRFDNVPGGAERNSYGLVHPSLHTGRIFEEVKTAGADLKKIKPYLDGTVPRRSDIALLYTYETHYDFAHYAPVKEIEGIFGNAFAVHLSGHYSAIAGLGLSADIVFPGSDFSAYKVIIAPALFCLTNDLAAKIQSYIHSGGTFLLTSLSGVTDQNGALREDYPPPGLLSPVFGVETVDYYPWTPELSGLSLHSVRAKTFPEIKPDVWIDEVRVLSKETQVLAEYAHPLLKKIPAVTVRKNGKGSAFYLGSIFSKNQYPAFYKWFLNYIHIKPVLKTASGVHAVSRIQAEREILFLINDHWKKGKFTLTGKWYDTIREKWLTGPVVLNPYEVLVLSSRKIGGNLIEEKMQKKRKQRSEYLKEKI